MSTKFQLSIRTRLVLNPSIIRMISSGLSCGCFTPLTSSFEKIMSMISLLLCFNGGAIWMLLTCLCYNFLRDSKDPPTIGPSLIILISPIVLFVHACTVELARCSCLYRPGMFVFTNFMPICLVPVISVKMTILLLIMSTR